MEQQPGKAGARDSACKRCEMHQCFFAAVQRCVRKNVWENCAKVLSECSDEELSPYLAELMVWLQDMNWPGAFCIARRLRKMQEEPLFCHAYTTCLKCAQALDDLTWEKNLHMLVDNGGLTGL